MTIIRLPDSLSSDLSEMGITDTGAGYLSFLFSLEIEKKMGVFLLSFERVQLFYFV